MSKKPATVKREAHPIKDPDQIGTIYRTMKKIRREREAEVFRLGCNCGLRISDILNIKKADVIYPDGTVKNSYELREIKTGKHKKIILNSTARAAIKEMDSFHHGHEYLFQTVGNYSGSDPKPVSTRWISKVFKDVREHLCLDYNFSSHTMRKTFGYHAYKNGEDIFVLQKLFNHRNHSDTFIYIGITEERVQSVYEKCEIRM